MTQETTQTEAASSMPPSTKDYLVVPTQVAQAMVNYLETKPFREVHQLIRAIIACNPKPDA